MPSYVSAKYHRWSFDATANYTARVNNINAAIRKQWLFNTLIHYLVGKNQVFIFSYGLQQKYRISSKC